jgi:hypothetical protein
VKPSALQSDVVILACAISAGIHGALVPEHFEDGAAAGAGFVAATIALAALATVLTYRPTELALLSAVAAFGSLIAAYAAVVVTGLPLVHPEAEAVEPLALFTKGVELLGLVAAAGLVRRPSFPIALSQTKGTRTT